MTFNFPTVALPRQYKFVEKQRWLISPLGEDLWRFLASRIKSTADIPLRNDTELNEIIHARMVGYVVARLVAASKMIRNGFPKGQLSGVMEQRLGEAIDEMLDQVTSLPEADRNTASDMLVAIVQRIHEEVGEPTSGQHNTIRRFAQAHTHRCYLCASPLEFEAHDPEGLTDTERQSAEFEHARRSYELEHIYPTSKGGGRARENLAACCHDCNQHKADLATFSEVAIESIIVSSEEEQSIRSVFGRRQRFAILWRQQGRCQLCEIPFYHLDDDRQFLVREDNGDAYHFLNVRIICGGCADAEGTQGVQIRGK